MKRTLQKNVEKFYEQQPKKSCSGQGNWKRYCSCSRFSNEQHFAFTCFQLSGRHQQSVTLQLEWAPLTEILFLPNLQGSCLWNKEFSNCKEFEYKTSLMKLWPNFCLKYFPKNSDWKNLSRPDGIKMSDAYAFTGPSQNKFRYHKFNLRWSRKLWRDQPVVNFDAAVFGW